MDIPTQFSCVFESLGDILKPSRPRLPDGFLIFEKPDETLCDNFELKNSSVISIEGKSHSGKTMLAMESMAQALLLPNEENPEVMFVNIEKDFNIFKFMEIW